MIDARQVERHSHSGNPRSTQDDATNDVGQIMDSQRNTGEADCQDHEHRERHGGSAPPSMQYGQEDEQQDRVAGHRRLGVATGEAQPELMGNRVDQLWAWSMNRSLDQSVQQR